MFVVVACIHNEMHMSMGPVSWVERVVLGVSHSLTTQIQIHYRAVGLSCATYINRDLFAWWEPPKIFVREFHCRTR